MKKLMFTIVTMMITVVLFVFLYSFTTTDANDQWLTVTEGNSAGWQITRLKDGIETPINASDAIQSPDTILLRRTVTEDWLKFQTIKVDGMRATQVWMDDTLVFGNVPFNHMSISELPKLPEPDGQAVFMVFSMDASWVGKTITLVSSTYEGEGCASIGFALLDENTKVAQTSAWTVSKAFPGVAFGVLFLLLMGLAMYRLTIGNGALPLFYLAFAALVQMLYYLDGLIENPITYSYFPVTRILCILLPLLYVSTQMGTLRKKFLMLILPLWSIYFVSEAAMAIFQIQLPFWIDRIAYLSLVLLVSLILFSYLEHRKGNQYFDRFLILLGVAGIGYLVALGCSYLYNDKLFEWFIIYWKETFTGYPAPLFFGVFSVVLIILFVLAIWDLVQNSIRSVKEIESLKLRDELTAQSLANVQSVNETLATVRHDELHHLRTIAALFQEDTKQAMEYANSLRTELEAIPSMRFTENKLVNAILSVQAGTASTKGVKLEVKAKLPETLLISETELSTVLMNLLENAIEAASHNTVDDTHNVTIHLEIEEGMLHIMIANSCPVGFDREAFQKKLFPTTKADKSLHGYGIRSVQTIVKRYGGELRYCVDQDVIRVNTVIEVGTPS